MFQNYADWTQESTCKTLTSCSCGILNNHDYLMGRKKNSNNYHASNYADIQNNYGWPTPPPIPTKRRRNRRQKRQKRSVFLPKEIHTRSSQKQNKTSSTSKRKNEQNFSSLNGFGNSSMFAENVTLSEWDDYWNATDSSGGSNRMKGGYEVEHNKYPWMALIFNRISTTCYGQPCPDPGDVYYKEQLCIITNS